MASFQKVPQIRRVSLWRECCQCGDGGDAWQCLQKRGQLDSTMRISRIEDLSTLALFHSVACEGEGGSISNPLEKVCGLILLISTNQQRSTPWESLTKFRLKSSPYPRNLVCSKPLLTRSGACLRGHTGLALGHLRIPTIAP